MADQMQADGQRPSVTEGLSRLCVGGVHPWQLWFVGPFHNLQFAFLTFLDAPIQSRTGAVLVAGLFGLNAHYAPTLCAVETFLAKSGVDLALKE